MTSVGAVEVVSARDVPPGSRIIDVRTPVEYAGVHAAGAQLVPLADFAPAKAAADCQGTLYLICKSGKRATTAAEKCLAAGITRVAVVEGGTDAWVAAGLPVVRCSGKPMMSLERQVRIAAGLLVLTGVILGATLHWAFFGLSGVVGAGLVFAGVTDTCGMGMLLARMPWNSGQTCPSNH